MSSTIFRPLQLRCRIKKYRAIDCNFIADADIRKLCVYLSAETITPQLRARLIKMFGKRHCLSPMLIKCWLLSFKYKTSFIRRAPVTEPVLVPSKLPFVRSKI